MTGSIQIKSLPGHDRTYIAPARPSLENPRDLETRPPCARTTSENALDEQRGFDLHRAGLETAERYLSPGSCDHSTHHGS